MVANRSHLVMFCLVLLSASALQAESPAPVELAPQLRTGTLLFSQGDCLAVRVFTQSNYTHVATVVVCDGQPVVYDSMNGVGVRRLPLANYLDAQSPDRLHLFQPCRELTPDECVKFAAYLESKLGTPYSVTHHLTGQRCEGVHCAEYVTDALQEIDWLRARNPPRVSPASLVAGITRAGVYHVGPTIELRGAAVPSLQGDNLCEQLWLDTKRCTQDCCAQLSRWFLCR